MHYVWGPVFKASNLSSVYSYPSLDTFFIYTKNTRDNRDKKLVCLQKHRQLHLKATPATAGRAEKDLLEHSDNFALH